MKKPNYFSSSLLVVALGVVFLSGCSTSGTSTGSSATGGSANMATLVVNRSANMGTGLFLNVSVDGKRVGSAPAGQSYKGSLSPGTHVVSVLLQPNEMNLSPTKKQVTAKAGQTVTLNAAWDGNTLSLQ